MLNPDSPAWAIVVALLITAIKDVLLAYIASKATGAPSQAPVPPQSTPEQGGKEALE